MQHFCHDPSTVFIQRTQKTQMFVWTPCPLSICEQSHLMIWVVLQKTICIVCTNMLLLLTYFKTLQVVGGQRNRPATHHHLYGISVNDLLEAPRQHALLCFVCALRERDAMMHFGLQSSLVSESELKTQIALWQAECCMSMTHLADLTLSCRLSGQAQHRPPVLLRTWT